MLCLQYRMHRDIGDFVSKTFYWGKVQSDETSQRCSAQSPRGLCAYSFQIAKCETLRDCPPLTKHALMAEDVCQFGGRRASCGWSIITLRENVSKAFSTSARSS